MAAQVYRHLLRSVPHAVRFNTPATKNIRRLLRDDFQSSLKAEISWEKMVEKASGTLLLYLASSRSKGDATKTGNMARRTISNLASLTYHHLSPYTHMQRFTKKRQTGGTDASHLRRRRSLQSSKSYQSSLDSFEVGSGPSSSSPISAQVLPSLVVLPKPIRGPMRPAESRKYLPSKWDGQRPVSAIQTSPAFMSHLQSSVDATGKRLRTAREELGEDSDKYKQCLEHIRKQKGDLKAAVKRKAKEDGRKRVQNETAAMLQGVVKKAEENSGAWLGADRFTRWATGGWLPP